MRLDIFEILKQINKANTSYLDGMSEEESKGFIPFVTLLWLKGAEENREYHLVLTDEIVNPYVFRLSKHPRLLYKLMCVANGFGDGTKYRYSKKAGAAMPKTVALISDVYGYNKRHALDALKVLTADDVRDIAVDAGYDDKEIKEVLGEWK